MLCQRDNYSPFMDSNKGQFSFTGVLESVRLNVQTTAVYLPHHIIAKLPGGNIRVTGTINGAPFSLAIRFRRNGSRYFTVGTELRNTARITVGDTVDVRFRIIDIHRADPPAILEVVTHHERERRNIQKLDPKGARDVLGNFVADITNMDIRLRRSIENVRKGRVATGLQPHQQRKNRKG